jgi:hypothetical protein
VLLVSAAIPFEVSAQGLRAITQDGKLVILNSDGTWRYADETPRRSDVPKLNVPAAFKRPVELGRGTYIVLLDEKKWRINKKEQEPGRFTFNHATGDVYAMSITERIAVPMETLKKIAIDNAREAAPDARVIVEERRRINGLDVLCMQIEGTLNGISFTYYGYYHSNDKGTVQLLGYTATNLFDEYRAELTDLLSGLTQKVTNASTQVYGVWERPRSSDAGVTLRPPRNPWM